MISFDVDALNPNTFYGLYVTCAREGTGGEGLPSSTVPIITLPEAEATTIPPSTSSIPTTRMKITNAHAPETQTATIVPITGSVITSPGMDITESEERTDHAIVTKPTAQVNNEVPNAPRNILVQRGSQDGYIVISWDPPDPSSSNGNIISYHIRYWKSSKAEMEFRIRLEGNKLTHTIDGLERNSTYNIQIQAESRVGKGPWTETVTIVLFSNEDSDTQGQADNNTVVIAVSVTACTVIAVLSVIVGVLLFVRLKSTRAEPSNDGYENHGVDKREGIAMTSVNVGYQPEVQDQTVVPGYEVHLPGPRAPTTESGNQGGDYEVVPGPEPSGHYEDLDKMGIERSHNYQSLG